MCKRTLQNAPDLVESIRVFWLLVGSPSQHSRKPYRDAGSMAGRRGDPFEAELEDVNWLDVSDRPESLVRVTPDPFVQLGDLFVGQPRVSFRNRNQLTIVPDAERVIGQQACAPAASRLCVDQHRVNGVRIDLPFPPVAPAPADAVR